MFRPEPPRHVAIVLKGYPRLSETFIAQELLGLQQAGLDFAIWSLRHPTESRTHPVHRQIRAPLRYLPEYLHDEPLRVLKGLALALPRRGFPKAVGAFLADLVRDPTLNRIRRFGQAAVLAAELPAETDWIHVHFLHTPASVARYAAMLRGLPWSCSAHAKDIYTSPDWEIAGKLADMEWLVTCTGANVARLRAAAPADTGKIALVYHGLDLDRFEAPAVPGSKQAGEPVRLLSVGRAVEKKGFDVLLRALARLPLGLDWRLTHVGGGDGLASLKALTGELGLDGRVDWLGSRTQDELLGLYRQADIFALASRIAADGDRDGLPNVLMEAQSQAVPSIATHVSAIPELIIDGETGLLVPPDDPAALAAALARLIADPELRRRLGIAGQRRLHERFGHHHGLADLAGRFGLVIRTGSDADRLLCPAERS